MDFIAPQVGQKVALPLATGATQLVSFELDAPEEGYAPGAPGGRRPPGGPPYLCCWSDGHAAEPKFYIPLKGCRIVNNITELGPCLYFIASTGEFEFQCPTRQVCSRWVETLKGLGVSLLKFTDLYKLTEFIGEGSFAKVYIGRHLFTGEDVVIKAVDKKKLFESNVYTEIEVLRKVSHPYIMRLYAAYEQEDFVCLVLEYLRGGELFDYLSEKGPFSEDQARHAMRRILLALQAMHMKGIVHRDLKTENLIIEHPSNPASIKIIDFGLAATVGSQAMKMRCGSPGYVAPEILQDLPYGPKVDVFSSGVILYTLLAGFPPFRGQNVKEILKKNLRCQISFNHERWLGIPHSVKDLIGWMCCKQPAKRCAAVQALTHPWFQRIARPLSKAAAAATAAAEQSDKETNFQHLQQLHRERQPLALRAGQTQGDSTELIDKRLQGLTVHSKDISPGDPSKGPSFFNSAPPGASGMENARRERDNQCNMQLTESQGDLGDPKLKQTHAEATKAAVKAAVKAVEAREAAAKAAAKAAAREAAAAKMAAKEAAAARAAAAAARQQLWTVQERDAHREERPQQEKSAAFSNELILSQPEENAVAAAAAAAAVTAVNVLSAAGGWQLTQQQVETAPCGSEVSPFPARVLDSVAVRASAAPAAVEVCERISSIGSDGQLAADLETPGWGPSPFAPTGDPADKPQDPEAAAAAAAAEAEAESDSRLQWLDDSPASPDSGISTQASPSGLQGYHPRQLSFALGTELPEPAGASSRGPRWSPSADPSEDLYGQSPQLPLGAPGAPLGYPVGVPQGYGDTGASGGPREAGPQQQTRPTNGRLDSRTAGRAPGATCQSVCVLSSLCHTQENLGPPQGPSEEVPEGPPQGPIKEASAELPQGPPSEAQQTQQDKEGIFLAEICPGASQSDLRTHRRRTTLRSPKPLEGSPSVPGGIAQRDPLRENSASNDEASSDLEGRFSQGPPHGGCTQFITGVSSMGPLQDEETSRGGDLSEVVPSAISPTGRQEEITGQKAPEGPPHSQGGPRTVRMQACKRLHSHHYLVNAAHEVLRSGSLLSGGSATGTIPVGNEAMRLSELEEACQGSSESNKTVGGPRGPASGSFGWRPSAVTGDSPCRYEGPNAQRPTPKKCSRQTSRAPTPQGSPRARPSVPKKYMTSFSGSPPLCSSSSSSSSSSRSNGLQQEPFHGLQSRLSELISLPVLSNVASALGARDWLKSSSLGASSTGDPLLEPAERTPSGGVTKSSKRDGRDARSSNRPRHREGEKRGSGC